MTALCSSRRLCRCNIAGGKTQLAATVKAAGAEVQALDRWSGPFMKAQAWELQRQRRGLCSEVGLDAVRHLLLGALLLEGGRRVLVAELSIGSLFAFLQMAGSLTDTFQTAASLWVAFALGRPQVARAQEILSLEPERPAPPRPVPATLDLRLEDVWFRYGPEAPWVIRGLQLHVAAGSHVGLCRPSGAGKTTTLRLAAGLLEPERGQVLLGGRPPREFRDQVVYLPQAGQIYGVSLLENLRIHSGQAPLEQLMAAASASGLARFAAALPMGYETILAPGGGNISGGQRQLILLTAAMATERRVLILDEAFANLDALGRSEILQGSWLHGKTVLFAGHDLTSIRTDAQKS